VHGSVPPLTHCSSDEIAAVPDMDIGSLGIYEGGKAAHLLFLD